jgi:hypothetical protein
VPNPNTENLTAEEKKTLKEIHSKYGQLSKAPLSYPVRKEDQTFNIRLK